MGTWVSNQRANKKANKITSDRLKLLNEIDFNWDPLEEDWEKGFNELTQFKKETGNCRVSQYFKVDGFNLGTWVSTQRKLRKQNKLTIERINRLDSIAFIWDAKNSS